MSFSNQMLEPFTLLLTHRKGSAVLACTPSINNIVSNIPNKFLKLWELMLADSEFFPWQFNLFHSLCLNFENNISQNNNLISTFNGYNYTLLLNNQTTAEHLSQMYLEAQANLNLPDFDFKHIIVGCGPVGSFTGLRLGCAFANGLSFGYTRSLWKNICAPLSELREYCISSECEQLWNKKYPEVLTTQDEFSASIDLLDVLYSITQISGSNCTKALQILLPDYSSEPGPVLKLMNNVKETV